MPKPAPTPLVSPRTRLKGLLEWFPAIYACMSLIGFIDYYTRYAPFNINIGEYLSAGELLMAFIPRAIETLFQMALGIVFASIMIARGARAVRVQLVDAEPRFTKLRRIAAGKNSGNTRFTRWITRSWFAMKRAGLNIGTTAFLLVVLFLLPVLTTRDTHQTIPLYTVGVVLFVWFVVFVIQMAKLVRIGLVSASALITITLGTLLCMYVVQIAIKNRYRSDELRSHPERQQWEVITSSDTLRSGDSLVFAGRIEAGIFLFDVRKKLPILVPTSEVRRLSIAESLLHNNETLLNVLLKQ